jgi:hypothetical protein
VARHHLDIIAPALNEYRHRLLTVTHDVDMVYPAEFDPNPFDKPTSSLESYRNSASSQEEFIWGVRKILSFESTISVLQSLIARSSESMTTSNAASDENLELAHHDGNSDPDDLPS